MEKVMLFCVFLYRIIQITSSDISEHDVTLLRFRLNGNISLNCNTTDKIRMSWYHQNPDTGRLTLLLYAFYKMYTSYQSHRMTFMGNVGTTTASLVITDLTESDAGLYFCGTSMHSDVMNFDKPIRLVMEDKEDKVHSVTEPPEDVEITASTVAVMLTERVMIFSGVGLAVFVFFLATVIAGGIIHFYGWQKGWTAAKRAGLTD
ncbi:uncharacterized protein LOC131526062 [Onychostoma macrolepis]|uniref:Ig-like domain-containing protein n=1 Tax=Onychostoma macrolepis TaxID=369639 RepID=A0A7J6C1R8_9TELE|nr:uncharacterized protein LOC131526062 [Onychostoma macrolepis]KAF4100924.1 hypothetical protein G5714_019120 [Onychostoma macrolepis]